MSSDFKIEGLDEFISKLQDSKQKLRKNIAKEMYQFAEEVMTESKKVVPVETGALMNTGKVMPPVVGDSSVTVELGYGDESVGYALIVHEELQTRKGGQIKWTRPGSGPKYLQTPFDAMSDKLAPRIAQAVTNAFTK